MSTPEIEILVLALSNPAQVIPTARGTLDDAAAWSEPQRFALWGILTDHHDRRAPLDLYGLRSWLSARESAPPTHAKAQGGGMRGEALKRNTGGVAYLDELVAASAPGGSVEHHLKRIRQMAALRKVRVAGQALLQLSLDPDMDGNAIAERAASLLTGLQVTGADSWRRAPEITTAAHKEGTERAEAHRDGRAIGIQTGIPSLDQLTGGFRAGDLVIIGARPGMGKTSLGLDIMLHNIRAGVPVGFVSREMSSESLADRLTLKLTGQPGEMVRDGTWNDEEFAHYTEELNRLSRLPWAVEERAASAAAVVSAAWRLHATGEMQVLIVDYLQRVTGAGDDGPSRLGDVVKACKTLARTLKLPVILLSQLNRECEKRKSPEPLLSDLKGSGDIEQEADKIILPYRPSEHDDDQPEDLATIYVVKARNGSLGEVRCRWSGPTASYLPWGS